MTQWVLCFWLVSSDPGVGSYRRPLSVTDDMEPSRTQRSRKSRCWLPAEARLAKAPNWLRSLQSLHRQRQDAKNAFSLPKLPSNSVTNGFHLLEEGPASDDGFNRIVLPPLCSQASPAGAAWVSPSAGTSWLLPTFPSLQRKEIYRQAREQRQLSAKVGRLPPINTTPPPSSTHSQSLSAPPPRSPRGVEGTSVMLLSSRNRSRIEGEEEEVDDDDEEEEEEEEEEVEMLANGAARHRNGQHVHVWAGRRDDSGCTTSPGSAASDVFQQSQEQEEVEEEVEEEEEEDGDEREEEKEKVALAALSGHRAPSVDESRTAAAAAVAASRDPPPPSTLTAVQWTIDWTPRVDVPDHSPLLSDADEIEEEMAAPWSVERHWRSARVRHSPPPVVPPQQPPHPPASPPVPALRAKTAHPSMSIELRQDQDDDQDEIIEEIEHIFDDFDLETTSDASSNRLRENDDSYGSSSFVKDLGDQPLFGVPIEQIKKILNSGATSSNNNDVEDAKETTSSSPTFRRHPSELVVPDCLPNAVQHNPDDRPLNVGRSPRVVHSPVEHQRRPPVFEEDDDNVDDDDDGEEMDNLRLPVKSRSVASFATSPSPDENARRQRSLPTRRHEGTNDKPSAACNGIKRIGVMPSSRRPAALAPPPSTASSTKPTQPEDPKTTLQNAIKHMNSSEWEVKVEGIRRLEELITSHSETVAPEVHIVVLTLLVEIKNLRSQVSRAAIQSMGKMFQHCGRHMEQDLDRTVPLLLSKVGDTNRFIRDDAHATLMNVTEYVSAPKAIVVIVAEGLTHKNATIRAEAAKLLAAIVVKMGPAKTLSGAKDVTERILPAAAHFIQDGSLEARAQAKRIFSVLINDPVFDKAMQKYLSPTVLRNIQRTLDQLRKSNH